MIPKAGLNRVRDLLNTEIPYGEVGTGTTDETKSDTALESPITETLNTTDNTTYDSMLIVTHTTLSTEANSQDITEFNMQTTTKSMNRVTFTAVSKDNTFDLVVRSGIFIRSS